jgi:hypothetical protein
MMADDIDQLFAAAAHRPPPDFAPRVTALARDRRQAPAPPPLTFWRFAALAASALCGALVASEFALFAFVATVAQ